MLKRLNHQLQYTIFRILAIFIENMPLRVAYGLSEVMGTLGYYFLKKRRETIFKNLDIVYPNGTPFEKKAFAKKNFIHMCNLLMEVFLANRLFFRDNYKDVIVNRDGLDEYKDAEQSKGAIYTTGHIGNFILAGVVGMYHHKEVPLYVVVRKLNNPYFMEYFNRTLGTIKSIPKQEAYEKLKEVVGQGLGHPIIVPDQHAGGNALHVDFLGRKAYTAAGPPALIRKYGVDFYFGSLIPVGMFKFEYNFEKLKLPPMTDDKQKDLENIALVFNDAMGKLVLKYPHMWLWMHRRWRVKKTPKKNKK